MPDDLWRREERIIAGDSYYPSDTRIFVLFPRPPLTPKDLNRYTRFYAKRIRHIEWRISIEDPVFSIEGLLALQIATDRIPGALTPLLSSFRWQNLMNAVPLSLIHHSLPTDFQHPVLPFMPLFLGPSVVDPTIDDFEAEHPLEIAAVEATARLLPHLQKLYLGCKPESMVGRVLIGAPWSYLQSVTINTPSLETMIHLASLTQLRRLEFLSMKGLPYRYVVGHTPTPAHREWFPSLEVVRIDSGNFRGAAALLQYLLPSNRVRIFEYRSNPIFSSGEAKDLIETLGDHLNPLYLQTSRMRDISFEPTNRTLEDIDLTPLLAFHRLEKVILAFFGGVKVTPKTLSSIATAWPNLLMPDK